MNGSHLGAYDTQLLTIAVLPFLACMALEPNALVATAAAPPLAIEIDC